MKERLKPGQWELISAALDGKLTPKERIQFDIALHSDQAFKSGIQEMETLVSFLRSVPQIKSS